MQPKVKQFDEVISLGYFCGPAMEIKRLERRAASYPFDWLIIDLQEVIRCLETGFDDFCQEDSLYQYKDNPYYYVDKKNNVHFYHDFDGYKDLHSQIKEVQEKYARRIKRMLCALENKNLYVRYIRDQHESDYIACNVRKIQDILKLDKGSELVLVHHSSVIPPKSFQCFEILGDKADDHFMEHNKNIENYVVSHSVRMPQVKGNKTRGMQKIVKRIRNLVLHPYVHDKTYEFK